MLIIHGKHDNIKAAELKLFFKGALNMHEGHDHHHHSHEEGFETIEQAVALMTYMLDHNRHHADELHDICHKLEAMGKTEAACLLEASVNSFNSGNEMLEAALENLKKED